MYDDLKQAIGKVTVEPCYFPACDLLAEAECEVEVGELRPAWFPTLVGWPLGRSTVYSCGHHWEMTRPYWARPEQRQTPSQHIDPMKWAEAAQQVATTTGITFTEANEALLRTAGLVEIARCAAGVVRTADPAKIKDAVVSEWWSALKEASPS